MRSQELGLFLLLLSALLRNRDAHKDLCAFPKEATMKLRRSVYDLKQCLGSFIMIQMIILI